MLVLLMIDLAVCLPAGDIDFHGIARIASSRVARLDVPSELGDDAAEMLSPPCCWFELGVAACALVVSNASSTQARQQWMLTANRPSEGAAPPFLCSSPVIDVPLIDALTRHDASKARNELSCVGPINCFGSTSITAREKTVFDWR